MTIYTIGRNKGHCSSTVKIIEPSDRHFGCIINFLEKIDELNNTMEHGHPVHLATLLVTNQSQNRVDCQPHLPVPRDERPYIIVWRKAVSPFVGAILVVALGRYETYPYSIFESKFMNKATRRKTDVQSPLSEHLPATIAKSTGLL